MENRNIEQPNQLLVDPHQLARTFEALIKDTVAQKFPDDSDDLTLLLEDEAGVYLSKEEANTLCCLLVGQKSGHMYLVTGRSEEGKFLSDLKCGIIS